MSKKDKKKNKKNRGPSAAQKAAKERASGFTPTAFKVPDGMSLFKMQGDGTSTVSLISYTTGKGNPRADKGTEYFEREYSVHRQVGPSKKDFVCLKRTFGKACPICEHADKLTEEGKEYKEMKELGVIPQRRQLFLVFDHKNEDAGVQLWNESFYCFGEALDKKISRMEEGAEEAFFYENEAGKILRIGYTEESLGKNKFSKCDDIEFRDRKGGVDADVQKQVKDVCLDSLLIEAEYDNIKSAFFATDDEDEGKEKKKDKKKKGKKKKK